MRLTRVLFGLALACSPCLAQNIITTLAGTGFCGFSGDGGPAATAQLCTAQGAAVDAAGNIYFQDNLRIRMVNPAGIITTIAGTGSFGGTGDGGPALSATMGWANQLAVFGSNLCFGDSGAYEIRCINLSTGIIQGIASIGAPEGAVFDENGNFFIADFAQNVVRRVDAVTGTVTIVAGAQPGGCCSTPLGDGGPAVNADLYEPWGLAYFNGTLYIADTGNSRIRSVNLATGIISSVTVNGSPYTTNARWITTDSSGNLFINLGTSISELDTSGNLTTIAGVPGISGFGYDDIPATQSYSGGYNALGWDPVAKRLLIPDVGPRMRQIFFTPATTTTLTSSANPTVPGGQSTLQATVSPAAATGNVRFYQGTLLLSSVPLSGNVATYVWSAPTGFNTTYSLRAVYGGDVNDNLSTSSTIGEVVGPQSTTTLLGSSANPATQGQNITFTVTVSPSAATGTVTLMNGSTQLGSATLSNGIATFNIATLSAGSTVLTANYAGSASYLASSGSLTQVVRTPSTTTLAATPSPAAYGALVTLTATVTPAAATGSVQFLNGSTSLGSANLASGQAQLAVSNLPTGSNSLTAVYSGDATYAGSTSAAVTESITISTTTTFYSTQNPTTPNIPISMIATVTPATSNGTAPTGTVQLLDGTTVVGTANWQAGNIQFPVTYTAVGTHSLTVVYSGDSNYAGSTSAVLVEQVKNMATGMIVVDVNPSGVGTPVTFTATVFQSAATGTIQFVDLSNNSAPLGTVPLTGSKASLTISTLTAGSHNVVANYSGDTNYVGFATSYLTQVVKPATTTSVSAPSGSSTYGQSVTFTATVAPAAATGTVQFSDGGTVLGTVALNSGTATLSVSTLSVDTHLITAAYSGDSTYFSSTSAAWTQTVAKAASATTIGSSPNPSNSGQAVTLTVAVSPAAATGRVQFLDGATSLGTVPLSAGTASLTTSALAAGIHSLTAVYGGDGAYAGSTSAVLSQTVKAATTTTVSSPGASTYGQAVTFSATVAPSGSTGSVQFFDGANPLGTAALNGSVASLPVSSLSVGAHSITAIYSGDTTHIGSTSAAWIQNVGKAAATTTLGVSPNPSFTGQTVTLSAVVSPAVATGTVQFVDGTTLLGTVALSGGVASLSTAGLAPGSHSLTAVYSGDGNFTGSSSSAVALTVIAPPLAPSNLNAVAVSSSEINLSWTASPTSGVTYNVYASTVSGFVPSASNLIASGIATTAFANTGLSPRTTYYYRVTAVNLAGESPHSNQARATTFRH